MAPYSTHHTTLSEEDSECELPGMGFRLVVLHVIDNILHGIDGGRLTAHDVVVDRQLEVSQYRGAGTEVDTRRRLVEAPFACRVQHFPVIVEVEAELRSGEDEERQRTVGCEVVSQVDGDVHRFLLDVGDGVVANACVALVVEGGGLEAQPYHRQGDFRRRPHEEAIAVGLDVTGVKGELGEVVATPHAEAELCHGPHGEQQEQEEDF